MSVLPSDLSKLPKWPFLLFDAILLGAAATLVWRGSGPLSGSALIAVAGLVGLAALVCIIPFLADYAHSQDQALDERQRALESLSQSVALSAEQIGVAAQGLSTLSDRVKDLLAASAEAPRELAEKLSELQVQLSSARDEEIEELEREIEALRSAEAERLALASEKIHKAIAELTRVESSASKHVAAAAEALARLQQAAHDGARQIASQSEKSSADAVQRLGEALGSTQAALDARLASIDGIARRLDTLIQSLERLRSEPHASAPLVSDDSAPTEAADAPETKPAPAPRRPRKPKAEPSSAPAEEPIAPEVAPVIEPEPVVAEPIPEPKAEHPIQSQPQPEPEPEPAPTPQDAPSEFSQEEQALASASTSVSADGATRLLVTAYIGIGNRLFVRGNAPGLSTDRGIPLQFVSIGKWRWESAEVSDTVRLRLLKNDQVECPSVGEIVLEPGHQAEVTASF